MLTRSELYEKVWSTPMRTLAKEFGISDVGLAKICRKHHVPLPGIGHWRRIETGHVPKRTPLPPIQQGQRETISITIREAKPYDVPNKADREPAPKIQVASDREIKHPWAVRTKRALSSASKDERGILRPKVVKTLHVDVSIGSVPRALRILDALFYALEERSYSVQWESRDDARLKIVVNKQELYPHLSEHITRKSHTLTPKETADRAKHPYSYYSPMNDFEPTGQLRLSVCNLPWEMRNVRTSWGDGKTRNVEDCLGEFIAILPYLSTSMKLVDEERERLRREEEQRQAEEARRKREEYSRKTKIVEQFLEQWQESCNFRDLALAIEQKMSNLQIQDRKRQDLQEITTWIDQHANNIDPLMHFDWMVRQFQKPPSAYGG
jgi:hypothetical protein